MFSVAKTKSVSGKPLYEVRRDRDGQTISEPWTVKADCQEWLKRNRTDLVKLYS